jgi:hypothetical protein
MQLPFTEPQFLDVFGAYNARVWPVVLGLWVATLWYSERFVRGQAGSVALSALGAIHWAWSGLVYHALFFTRINPAAWLFAALFVLQAVAFMWLGIVRRSLIFHFKVCLRRTRTWTVGAVSDARIGPVFCDTQESCFNECAEHPLAQRPLDTAKPLRLCHRQTQTGHFQVLATDTFERGVVTA